MAGSPTPRALIAFARLLSSQIGLYRCPTFIRLGRTPPNEVTRRNLSGIRAFSAAAPRRSDDFLSFQLSHRQREGEDNVELDSVHDTQNQSHSANASSDLETVETALEMSEFGIEELED